MSIDFTKLLDDFKRLKPGPRADLRRTPSPGELRNIPAYYRLAASENNECVRRVIFVLAGVKPDSLSGEKITAGTAIARKDSVVPKDDKLTAIGTRLVQIDRAESGRDIKQFRSLIEHLQPAFNWETLAKTLYYWDQSKHDAKRQMLEDYFLAKYSTKRN